MNHSLRLTVITLLLAVSNLSAATRYVGRAVPARRPPTPPGPAPPTSSRTPWTPPRQGDSVLVAGGCTPRADARLWQHDNRVAVDRAITVESLMGRR